MSYYKVKNISFSKDFRTVNLEGASNNIRPLWYNKVEIKAKEDETTFDFVKGFANDFLSGGAQTGLQLFTNKLTKLINLISNVRFNSSTS